MDVDAGLWLHLMVHEARKPPPFFPTQFKQDADMFLWNSYRMTRENITHSNVKDTYMQLVHHFAGE